MNNYYVRTNEWRVRSSYVFPSCNFQNFLGAYQRKMLYLVTSILIQCVAMAQECSNSITILLQNMKGGVYKNQTVKLTSSADGEFFEVKSNDKGEVVFKLPCNTVYELSVPNYTRKKVVSTTEYNGAMMSMSFTYYPDMVEKEKLFAMNATQKIEVDNTAASLPDTTIITNSKMESPSKLTHFSSLSITLMDIEGKPLNEEMVCFTGIKRNKSVKGITNSRGKLTIYLPKGDEYSLNFKYDKDYAVIECKYTQGSAEIEISYSYLGTKEIERRKKIEEERIAAEEKRLREEEERFKKYCDDLGISIEEGRKRELESLYSYNKSNSDTVVSAVLNRNKWDDKLIVCDLTGSMSPYSAQLSLWFQLHHQLEKNLQFVFFNDGDNKADEDKIIGNTGGIYYSSAVGLTTLASIVAKVSAAGGGGDCPENNMEALIKGTELASPYKELVMIVDNNAPVKDIELLKNFKTPVHIILCGSRGWVLSDYLLIAWKTGGSIHTIEEDITSIAKMAEGQELKINGSTYKIMGGKFVQITKT